MNLQQRIYLMVELGKYILSDEADWQAAREKAYQENSWFTPEFIELATYQIAAEFLSLEKLESWVKKYKIPDLNSHPSQIGLVMAGNIPLVGFHDFLSVFVTGHRQSIKASGKDQALISQLINRLHELDSQTREYVSFAQRLNGCDAYIATGSNNTARYFDYYFGKYPHIIRHNRTSVAVLNGKETGEDLEKLADDVYQYFGLGCRNVTKIHVPEGYEFKNMLDSFSKYNYLADQHKYKNNYDYQLTLLILNRKFYMTNGSVLLTEEGSPYSAISVLHFEYYRNQGELCDRLRLDDRIQCIVGQGFTGFGEAQKPSLTDYADGVDTLAFLLGQ